MQIVSRLLGITEMKPAPERARSAIDRTLEPEGRKGGARSRGTPGFKMSVEGIWNILVPSRAFSRIEGAISTFDSTK